jgi:predicted nucleic acid-binding protein
MSARAFLDTNILIYALAANEPRSATAEKLLLKGGIVSVQVLNEFASVARRKLALSWPDVKAALSEIRLLCNEPIPLTVTIHDRAVALAEHHGLSVYDAMVVAAAMSARCEVLFSEDMQDGRRFDGGLRIENPFKP